MVLKDTLDLQPQWIGHWSNIERTRHDAARRRPLVLTLDIVNELLLDPTTNIQHDVNRGIIRANGKHVAERGDHDLMNRRANDFFDAKQAMCASWRAAGPCDTPMRRGEQVAQQRILGSSPGARWASRSIPGALSDVVDVVPDVGVLVLQEL